MPDGQIQMRPVNRLPILWIALGRQRVGKTALLNTAVQYFRTQGNPVRVWMRTSRTAAIRSRCSSRTRRGSTRVDRGREVVDRGPDHGPDQATL